MLKISAVYLDKRKRFVPKKYEVCNVPWIVLASAKRCSTVLQLSKYIWLWSGQGANFKRLVTWRWRNGATNASFLHYANSIKYGLCNRNWDISQSLLDTNMDAYSLFHKENCIIIRWLKYYSFKSRSLSNWTGKMHAKLAECSLLLIKLMFGNCQR